MLNRTLVLAAAGILGLAVPAFAQPGDASSSQTKVYSLSDGSGVVRERVVEEPASTIERTIIIGPAYRMPTRNTGVSRINGGVGGAIGGYYIVGSTPAENRSLYIPWWVDSYQH